MKKNLLFLLIIVTFTCSCSTKTFIPAPAKPLPPVNVTCNHYEYGIENVDKAAKCDRTTLTAFYESFNIKYYLDDMHRMIFEIENRNNNSLIIDKSKSFVLYDGYTYELFKDVRTGKITTFNNVQDAVNSVQTNESSVTMSIPPYSKWVLVVPETNVKEVAIPKKYETIEGNYSLTPYTTEHTIEFIIPYTYDYKLASWKTARNRLYVDNIRVDKSPMMIGSRYYRSIIYKKNEIVFHMVQKEDLYEYDAIEEYNNYGRFQYRSLK